VRLGQLWRDELEGHNASCGRRIETNYGSFRRVAAATTSVSAIEPERAHGRTDLLQYHQRQSQGSKQHHELRQTARYVTSTSLCGHARLAPSAREQLRRRSR
jgi:hypothetical protein